MSLLNLIMENKDVVDQIANQFGLSEEQAKSGIEPLAQNIGSALKKNTQSQGGMESLLKALANGNHMQSIEQPSRLADQETTQDGNAILGHLFGSKDVSRQVASQASAQSGLDAGILKQMLPLIASVAMGKLGGQANNQGLLGNVASIFGGESSSQQSQLSGFASLLDSDGDGSLADDALGFATKLFGSK